MLGFFVLPQEGLPMLNDEEGNSDGPPRAAKSGGKAETMSHERAVEIVRDNFSHVDVEKLVVEHDPVIGEDVAKVFVLESQLEEALGKDSIHARLAAIRSGLTVEVVLSEG